MNDVTICSRVFYSGVPRIKLSHCAIVNREWRKGWISTHYNTTFTVDTPQARRDVTRCGYVAVVTMVTRCVVAHIYLEKGKVCVFGEKCKTSKLKFNQLG